MIKFMTTPRQKVWGVDGDPNRVVPRGDTGGAPFEADGKSSTFNLITTDGVHEIRRALQSGGEDYIVCSMRDAIIWDNPLIQRVLAEIDEVNAIGPDWLCLVAEGQAVDGRRYAAAFFDEERTLVPDRGRNFVVQTSGTFYVFNVARLRRIGLGSLPNTDFVELVNQLIILGYANGLGTIQSDRLFPCFSGRRDLSYVAIEDQIGRANPIDFLSEGETDIERLTTTRRIELLRDWVEDSEEAFALPHSLSFVIRTIFKRPFLLRRCLISIDYLRRSLDIPAEIVLATDTDAAAAERTVSELRLDFPDLIFVLADGNTEAGHSRVRNLIAGVKATTGTRVAIIDDDDFFTPEAVGAFAYSLRREHLILFDTQIVNEKWDQSAFKPQRQLISYGYRHEARGWVETVGGYNSIPLCGLIHPGDFARLVIAEYRFAFDYSEDFVFHLMALTHRFRPPLVTLGVLGAYQSHRVGDDNVSTVEDRTPWVLDVGNGTYELLIKRGYAFEVIGGEVGLVSYSEDYVNQIRGELARTTSALQDATAMLAKTIGQLRRSKSEHLAAKSFNIRAI